MLILSVLYLLVSQWLVFKLYLLYFNASTYHTDLQLHTLATKKLRIIPHLVVKWYELFYSSNIYGIYFQSDTCAVLGI